MKDFGGKVIFANLVARFAVRIDAVMIPASSGIFTKKLRRICAYWMRTVAVRE